MDLKINQNQDDAETHTIDNQISAPKLLRRKTEKGVFFSREGTYNQLRIPPDWDLAENHGVKKYQKERKKEKN